MRACWPTGILRRTTATPFSPASSDRARDRGRPIRVHAGARGHPPQHRGAADRDDRRGRPAGCTPRARATTRSRPISASGCATRSTGRRRCAELQARCSTRAEAHAGTVMPGFTHLQPAQPVTFGHHLLAYVEMLGRDRGRFADAGRGSTNARWAPRRWPAPAFPSTATATAGGWASTRPMANSIDAVSDRDFALEYLAAAAICAVHLSRLAEELVLWSTPQFGFVAHGRRVHHRQLDHAAEAQPGRGRAGARQGRPHDRPPDRPCWSSMKGLPLAYSKDMQEDKEAVFDAADTLELCLEAMAGMVARLTSTRRGCGPPPGSAIPPPPTSPIGWCGRGCPSATPMASPAASVKPAEERGVGSGPAVAELAPSTSGSTPAF